jgi:YNFM family putative membrane transporter
LLPALAGILAGIVALTIGFFIAHAVASGWVGRRAQQHKGHASSLYLLAYYGGSSVMGSVGGWFWAAGGWPAIVAFAGALFLMAFMVAMRLRRL